MGKGVNVCRIKLNHFHFKSLWLYLVVVAVSDGIGMDSSLLHLKQDSDCQHRLAILSTQLHQHPVTDLYSLFTHVNI